ncbi:patatin-like phospholipase family protein [Brachybacterium subflavum]|uniref:patatin-like phospholipase family protein n=1 Tax=Brachybacterium subflavum TaxID=2585206 RepID=UPI0012666251|nr:patatin-like phospholipase family protein [Brachybacterium subflavum]
MRIELVLGAGSAYGLAHLGVLRALRERGHEIVRLHGCSMGALVAGAVAAGSMRTLERLADRAGPLDALRLVDPPARGAGLVGGRRIERLLDELYDDRRIEDLDLPLRVVATDVTTWLPVAFESGELRAAVRASIGVPALLPPIEIDGRVLADGTLVQPLPIPDQPDPEAQMLLAVSVLGPPSTHPWEAGVPRRRAARYVMDSLSIAQHGIELAVLAAHPEAALLQLPAGDGASALSFHRAGRIAARGHLIAREQLPALGL